MDITPTPTGYAVTQARVLLSWAGDSYSLAGVDFERPNNQATVNQAWLAFDEALESLRKAGLTPTDALKTRIAKATLTKFFHLV